MDEKALLVLLTIVFLVLQFVFYMVTKSSNTEIIKKMDDKFEKVLERFDARTKELADEIKSKREGYNQSIQDIVAGIQETLIIVKQSNDAQHEVSDNMLKISISQKNISRIQERLEEKLSVHVVTMAQTQERFEEKLTVHAIDCKERNAELRQSQGVS